MPAAKGLFHKAVVLSGASLKMGEKEHAEKLGAAVLAEAGLAPAEIEKLQQMPWKDFYAVATQAQQKLDEQGGAGHAPRLQPGGGRRRAAAAPVLPRARARPRPTCRC